MKIPKLDTVTIGGFSSLAIIFHMTAGGEVVAAHRALIQCSENLPARLDAENAAFTAAGDAPISAEDRALIEAYAAAAWTPAAKAAYAAHLAAQPALN